MKNFVIAIPATGPTNANTAKAGTARKKESTTALGPISPRTRRTVTEIFTNARTRMAAPNDTAYDVRHHSNE